MMKYLSYFLKSKVKIYYNSFKIVLYPLLTKTVYFIFIITHLRTLSYLPYSHKTSLNLQLSKIETVMNVSLPCYI